MSSPSPDRKALEELWLSRLNDAKLRLAFARNYMGEVQRDYPAGDIPPSDHHYAHQTALHAENSALAEYSRILRIYTDLTVRGVIPDETEWLEAQAENASRSKSEVAPAPAPEPAREQCPEHQEIVGSIKAVAGQINLLLQREVEAVKSQNTDELIRIGHHLDQALDLQESLRHRLKTHAEQHGCQRRSTLL